MTQTEAASVGIKRITAKLGIGDVDGACDLAREAYISGVADPLVFSLLAHRMEERGDIEEALQLLHEALALAPEDALIYASIGHCLIKLARPMHALEAFNRALKINKSLPRAHHGAGLALVAMGEEVAGDLAHRRARMLDPKYPAPIGTLALNAYRNKDFAAAESLSEEALRLDANEPGALIVKGSLYWDRGEAQACADMFGEALRSVPLAPLHRSAIERQYADALDKLGRRDEAFAAYTAANALLRRVYEDRFDAPDVESMTQVCERLLTYFRTYDECSSNSPSDFVGEGAREHVFLMGFPRSGTTLLEQVLAGHPDVEALEEMPTLDGAIQAYITQTDDMDLLMTASESDLNVWRADYWSKVKSFGASIVGKCLVDKQPSLTPHLPLIRRLFPTAKILFCIRDPRDVVLGCFRRNFRMSANTFEYTTIENLANFYARTMELATLYFEKLNLDVHRHRHEDLVSNFSAEVEALCRFLGLTQHADMHDIVATTNRRDVRTPSARQIRQGLNASGVGYWKTYRRHLEAQLPLLEIWADKFGYESAFKAIGAESIV